jgi:general secretion pathway protein D
LLRRRRATIYVSVIRRANQIIVRTGDESTMEQIRDLIQRLDVPTPLVLLGVKILSVVLGDDFNSVFDYQFSDGVTVAGGFTTGNILPPVSDNPARIVPPRLRRDSPIDPETSSAWNNTSSTEDLTFQFVNDNFRFRMQLLESNNRVTTLATPLLLTAHNEVSRIFIGQTEPFTIGFEAPQVVTSGTTQTNIVGTPITELRDVGQSLLITPSINADRTVTLRIAQQQSRKEESGAQIPVLDADGNVQQVPVDTVARETVSGTIVGKDGMTVALGGLIEERADDIRAAVPIVGKLPVVGFFFRRQHTGRRRLETVILVRPYVFNTPSESAAVSGCVLRDLSIHPLAYTGDTSLRSHAPWEVVRPVAPINQCQNTFRFHSVRPRRF